MIAPIFLEAAVLLIGTFMLLYEAFAKDRNKSFLAWMGIGFLSLVLVTISFYILVGYMRRNANSLEAGVKYLVLGALSTGFLVYGITWIFGVTGETNLQRIAQVLSTLQGADAPLLFGVMLILV